jgi:hypothetical protein
MTLTWGYLTFLTEVKTSAAYLTGSVDLGGPPPEVGRPEYVCIVPEM